MSPAGLPHISGGYEVHVVASLCSDHDLWPTDCSPSAGQHLTWTDYANEFVEVAEREDSFVQGPSITTDLFEPLVRTGTVASSVEEVGVFDSPADLLESDDEDDDDVEERESELPDPLIPIGMLCFWSFTLPSDPIVWCTLSDILRKFLTVHMSWCLTVIPIGVLM